MRSVGGVQGPGQLCLIPSMVAATFTYLVSLILFKFFSIYLLFYSWAK